MFFLHLSHALFSYYPGALCSSCISRMGCFPLILVQYVLPASLACAVFLLSWCIMFFPASLAWAVFLLSWCNMFFLHLSHALFSSYPGALCSSLHLSHALFSYYPDALCSSCISRMGCFPLILVHYVLPASLACTVFLLSWSIMFFLHLSHGLFSYYPGAICSSCIYRMRCFPLILVHYVLPASLACAVFLLSWCNMFFLHLSHALFSSYPGAICSSCIYRMRCFPLILVHYVLPASLAWDVLLLSWCIMFFLHLSHGMFSSYPDALCSSCIYRMRCFPLILVHYVLPASIACAVFLLSWCIMFFLHLSHGMFYYYPGALCSSCISRIGCFPLILMHYVLPASLAWAVFLLSWCIMFFLHLSHALFSSYPGALCSSCIYRWAVFLLSWCIMFFLHLSHALFSYYPDALCSSCIYRMGCFPNILVHYVLPASNACAVFLLSWCIMFFLHLSYALFSSNLGALCSSCIYRMRCFPLIVLHYVLPSIANFPPLSLLIRALQHLHSIGTCRRNRLVSTTNYEKHNQDEGSFP